MYATKIMASLLTLLFWCNWVLAFPVADVGYRQVQTTNSGLEPWVTIIASGVRSTITPILTTIDSMPTTINAFPSPTITTSFGVVPDGTSTASSPTSTSTGIGAFEICHNVDGPYAPLCPMPNNNTLYVSEIYYVTWDTGYYTASNATVRVVANYNNATGGPQAFESEETLNSWGYVSLKVDKDWLQGSASNNLTLFITSLEINPQGAQQTVSRPGPIITITSRPYQPYTPPPPTKAPQGASLFIALPTVAAFVILGVCGLCILNRKHRQIGLGNIMGRNRGYRPGSKKSRRQRMGFSNNGAIKLSDHELRNAPNVYRDVPADWKEDDPFTDKPGTGIRINVLQSRQSHSRSASDGLDSLAGTPTEESSRDENWPFGSTPTRSKAVGDSGFVKEEVKHIEQQANGAA